MRPLNWIQAFALVHVNNWLLCELVLVISTAYFWNHDFQQFKTQPEYEIVYLQTLTDTTQQREAISVFTIQRSNYIWHQQQRICVLFYQTLKLLEAVLTSKLGVNFQLYSNEPATLSAYLFLYVLIFLFYSFYFAKKYNTYTWSTESTDNWANSGFPMMKEWLNWNLHLE